MSSGVTGSEGTATDDDDKPPEAGTSRLNFVYLHVLSYV